ncbi:MAG: hypothetical protein IPN34_03695 [Planctomycetes bacterium]|nr:hypothetical protein [Planctomycetota bacterium]
MIEPLTRRTRFRRLQPPRLPRWYLVDGKPRRSLWPPEMARVPVRELRRLLELAREGTAAHPDVDREDAPERRCMRAVLELLERALDPNGALRAAPGRADATAAERAT